MVVCGNTNKVMWCLDDLISPSTPNLNSSLSPLISLSPTFSPSLPFPLPHPPPLTLSPSPCICQSVCLLSSHPYLSAITPSPLPLPSLSIYLDWKVYVMEIYIYSILTWNDLYLLAKIIS